MALAILSETGKLPLVLAIGLHPFSQKWLKQWKTVEFSNTSWLTEQQTRNGHSASDAFRSHGVSCLSAKRVVFPWNLRNIHHWLQKQCKTVIFTDSSDRNPDSPGAASTFRRFHVFSGKYHCFGPFGHFSQKDCRFHWPQKSLLAVRLLVKSVTLLPPGDYFCTRMCFHAGIRVKAALSPGNSWVQPWPLSQNHGRHGSKSGLRARNDQK